MKFILHPEADREVTAAEAWYNDRRSGLGAQFLDEAILAKERIEQFPRAWQRLDADYRCISLRRFPYGIVYKM